MRQHNKVSHASGKHKRRERWNKGLEILENMVKPKPYTKRGRRMLFAKARKLVFKNVKAK